MVLKAISQVETTREPCWEAEAYRLKGRLLLSGQAGTQTEAEGCFTQGLEMARRHEARFLELRATTNLARLWQGQGKAAARSSRDLKDAKALLEGLK